MKISDYDYELPEEAIAVHPPEKRGASRLLVLDRKSGKTSDRRYSDLPGLLNPGDLLVINDTRVIKARLIARTDIGTTRELLLLERHGEKADLHHHRVMYRGKLRPGMELTVGDKTINVKSVLDDGLAEVSSAADLFALAETHGHVPLPPYIRREADETDTERYQTVFARENGSIAAPTASLNLTEEILEELRAAGIRVARLTLHVGLGTFMPIRSDNVEEHTMHREYFHIPSETIAAIIATKAEGKRVIALGTTVARTLEYAAENILSSTNKQASAAERFLSGEADIFIYPGYEFQLIDGLLTNFHAPRSTVLMLAAAFAGWDNLKAAYAHALKEGYGFLSYGDSMLII